MTQKSKPVSIYNNMDAKQTIEEWELRTDKETVRSLSERWNQIMSDIELETNSSITVTAQNELFAKLIRTGSIIGFNKKKVMKMLKLI